jgi:hypothetical protein
MTLWIASPSARNDAASGAASDQAETAWTARLAPGA